MGIPGLVVTRASCYSYFSQKLEDNMTCELNRIKSTSNQLCIRKLEMIDGNKKKLWPKQILPLRVNVLHFCNFTLRQKYLAATTGN